MRITLILFFLPIFLYSQTNLSYSLRLRLFSSGFKNDYVKFTLSNAQKDQYLLTEIYHYHTNSTEIDTNKVKGKDVLKLGIILEKIDFYNDSSGITFDISDICDTVPILEFVTCSKRIYFFGQYNTQSKTIHFNSRTPVHNSAYKVFLNEFI